MPKKNSNSLVLVTLRDCARIVPMVDYTAQLISRMLR